MPETLPETIDDAVVRRTARLARLALSDEEVPRFGRELRAIVEHVRAIEKLELKDVLPTAHAIALVCPMVADELLPSLAHPLMNAPEHEGTAFKVPKIIE